MTEYEERFSNEGFRIYRLETCRRGENRLTRAHTPERTAEEIGKGAPYGNID